MKKEDRQIIEVSADTRIVDDGIQWTVQEKSSSGEWTGRYFFRAREWLIKYLASDYAIWPPPASVKALPRRHP